MPAANNRRFLATSAERRLLRAATALGTATLLSAGGVGIANAESAIPSSSVVSTADVDVTSETDAVKQLKANYFANVDAKDWVALRALFAPDAVVDTTNAFGPYMDGRDQFINFTRLILSVFNTHHQGFDPQITFTAPTTATVVWQMKDELIFANLFGMRGTGVYTDRYQKVGDEWVVVYSKLDRTSTALVSPLLSEFLPRLGEVLISEGPVAALQYAINFAFDTVVKAVAVPFNVVRAVLPLNVESSVLTADTNATFAASTVTDASANFSNRSLVTLAPASTEDVPAADAAPSVPETVEAEGTVEGAAVATEKQAEPATTVHPGAEAGEDADPVGSAPDQPADEDTAVGAEANGLTRESPSTREDSDDSPNAADAKGDTESN